MKWNSRSRSSWIQCVYPLIWPTSWKAKLALLPVPTAVVMDRHCAVSFCVLRVLIKTSRLTSRQYVLESIRLNNMSKSGSCYCLFCRRWLLMRWHLGCTFTQWLKWPLDVTEHTRFGTDATSRWQYITGWTMGDNNEGKSFHIRTTGKARRPTVESLTAGTNRLSVTEDRSLCCEGMSAVRVNCCRLLRSVTTQGRRLECRTGWMPNISSSNKTDEKLY